MGEEYGVLSLGILRSNRLRGCPLPDDKKLCKWSREAYEQKVDDKHKVVAVKWFNNESVIIESSYYEDAYPVEKN